MNFVQAGGGSKRLASVMGGHTDIAMFPVPEFVKFKASGLRPLVVFSEQRSEQLPDVPTAKELGIDMMTRTDVIWLLPKGTPQSVIEYWTKAFTEVLKDSKVRKEFEPLGLTPEFIPPEETVNHLRKYAAEMEKMVPLARSTK